MKKIIGLLSSLFVAFCIGTVLSIVVFVGMLWWKGGLTGDRFMSLLASLQGIDMATAAATLPVTEEPNDEQVSYDDILEKRALAGLDLDLRESAIDKSLGELRNLESLTKTERERLDLWKQSFDQRLASLETEASETSLRELQTTLEAMNPKQAKEQILIMLDSPIRDKHDNPIFDVVTIFKTMPIDKRRKIVSEFKTPEETEKLAEILHEIRLGTPDEPLIRDTRNQLQQQLNPQR
jgi:hypothetical protein